MLAEVLDRAATPLVPAAQAAQICDVLLFYGWKIVAPAGQTGQSRSVGAGHFTSPPCCYLEYE
ncbi:MAG: hypothetical protein Q8K85_06880 [Hyphomicrobium sp.]|nr:hypothetical protein [Hyphomicrobium sp.]